MKKLNRISKIFLFVALIAGVFILTSCPDSRVICGDPPYYHIQIILVDHNDSLLIGSKYNQDSIRLTVDTVAIVTYIQKGIMTIDYAGLDKYNSKNYLLYLSKEDMDTLNLNVVRHYADCGDMYYVIGGLKYNSKNISPVAYNKFLFRIIKE